MKYLFSLLILSAFWVASLAAPHPAPHVVHEARDTLPPFWYKRYGSSLEQDTKLPIRIGLTQSNLQKGSEILMDVSSPHSSNYGKHYSKEEVTNLFAPSNETVEVVKTWLVESGIDKARISQSQGRNWLKFDATIAEAEELLHTDYHVYEHDSGATHIACESYNIPKHLQDHVDLIVPTIQFDVHVENGGLGKELKNRKRDSAPDQGVGSSGPRSMARPGAVIPNLGAMLNSSAQRTDLCNSVIFPECLQALYQIPIPTSANPDNSLSIVEYTPQAFVQSDLDLFLTFFNPAATGSQPEFKSIDGGDVIFTDNMTGFNTNGESDLDLQYTASLVYPQKVTLYQVGDLPEAVNNSFNNFLDAIDGSYCTFDGGDDPAIDAVYPDPLPGGYKSQDCGIYKPTKVISTSYGYNEADLTPKYAQRQCSEYMKLGLQGVTVVYSSGDNGVAGNGGACLGANSTQTSDGNRFNPGFPSSCSYITSVGATQIRPNGSVTQPEEACETVIYSGGGFSNVFPLPDYQSATVKKYLTDPASKPTYNSTTYNDTGNARGYPDISANGANYAIILDGTPQLIYGTSASAPVIASIFTLINGERMNAGKGPIGFVNPTLYANPDMFNDITSGGNQGCGTSGFEAVVGWDPVTGLGTPKYERMRDVFMSLP